MRVHSALQRAFPHCQLRKTAAIDLRGRRHGGRNGHVGFGFRVRVINSFAAPVYIHSVGRSLAPSMCVFTILQYRRPEWVKTRVAGPFTSVWKYLQEFQIELTGGVFGVAYEVSLVKPHRATSARLFHATIRPP